MTLSSAKIRYITIHCTCIFSILTSRKFRVKKTPKISVVSLITEHRMYHIFIILENIHKRGHGT